VFHCIIDCIIACIPFIPGLAPRVEAAFECIWANIASIPPAPPAVVSAEDVRSVRNR
jgi:hypothetical protein